MANFWTCVAILLSVVLYLTPVNSVKPDDEIHLTNFNQSFYLANETFTFQLTPKYNVPRQVLRHTIYTSSRDAIQGALKRAILDEPGMVSLSEEDYIFVHKVLDGNINVPIKVDKKKRSLPLAEGDLRIVPVTSKATLISSGFSRSMKRDTSGTELGESLCLHVPFFTTCDNSEDLSQVKDALTLAVNAIHTELDDYKKVNDDRAKALAAALGAQRDIIDKLAQLQQTQNEMIAHVATGVQTNAAEIMDGDYQIHSQVNFLKRITDSLIKYSNALASTDPRATTAQPAMSKLFQGYIDTIQNLTTIGYQAIVDNSTATAFTWTETLLPSQSVTNITTPPCTTLTNPCIRDPLYMTTRNSTVGFMAVFSYTCSGSSNLPACSGGAVLNAEAATNWIYGPFHKNHYGIYSLNVTWSGNKTELVKVMRPIVTPKTGASVAYTVPKNTPAFCVNFLGFKLFSSYYDPSTTLINSYKPPASGNYPTSDCDTMRLLEAQRGSDSAGVLPAQIYSLYGETEGIVVPFYSNCQVLPLQTALYIAFPGANIISTINYTCSNAWTLSQPTPLVSACGSVPQSIIDADVFSRHWVTSDCYINLEPGWLGLDYYVNPPLLTIPNIPRGYQLNQFTINAYGELASSIEFVYTDTWLQVYTIKRTSQNRIITDEISLLDGSSVLFYLDANEVIDESDSMYGIGNNGRDCIQQSDRYDYNLLNCFFQNLSPSYPPNLYLSGSVTTSGIARYNSKFDFDMSTVNGISFSLTPKKDLDFSYSVVMDGFICPSLISQVARTSGCTVKLFYLGQSNPVVLSPSSSTQNPIPVNFASNNTKDVQIGIGIWTVNVGGKQCFILDCSYILQFNMVRVSTPNVDIRAAADVALVAQVQYSSDLTLASTVQAMEAVISNVSTANDQIDRIRSELQSLNFDMSELFPYDNFTELREDVHKLIAMIPTTSDTVERDCSGPFNSVSCWFADFIGVIIGVGLILAVLVVCFCIVTRTSLGKKLVKGPSKFKSSSSLTSGQHIPEYRAD